MIPRKSVIKMESPCEGYGSVSEIEELRKRIERLGRNSSENDTPVDSTCVSAQPSNLKNSTFSSADRSKQHHGNDNVQIPDTGMFKGFQLPTGNERMVNHQLYIARVKADDTILRLIRAKKYVMENLERNMNINVGQGHYNTSEYERRIRTRKFFIEAFERKMKINEGKDHYNTSEYQTNLKNLSKVELAAKVVELENKINNLKVTGNNQTHDSYKPVDSRSIGGQPSNLLNSTFLSAEHHHGSKRSLFREKFKWKPYHKLTGYERLDQWHIRRAEAHNRVWMINHLRKKHQRYNINSSEDKVDNIECSENKIDCNASENESDMKIEGVEKVEMENEIQSIAKSIKR